MPGKLHFLYGLTSSIGKRDISSLAYKHFTCITVFSMAPFSKNNTNNHLLFSSFIEKLFLI